MALEASTTHELLGRVRARLGVLRPRRGLAQRTVFRAVLFATFVAAVSLVGRAWALARLPSAAPLVADRVALIAPAASPSREPPAAELPMVASVGANATNATSAPRSPEVPTTGDPLVNLNTATASELETLPYVGPKRAQAILALRTKLGRFKSVDELLKVKGIGRGTLKRMRARVSVGPA